jgi:hypothetical protein
MVWEGLNVFLYALAASLITQPLTVAAVSLVSPWVKTQGYMMDHAYGIFGIGGFSVPRGYLGFNACGAVCLKELVLYGVI